MVSLRCTLQQQTATRIWQSSGSLKGYEDVAEVLLANGADVNAGDKKGTPLAWGDTQGHPDIAKLLRQHGGHE
jgi:ankyrin repeat protein